MINVAVIGTGTISSAHINGYLQFPERCKIVALIDIYPEKAEKMAEKFNLNADIYSDYKELYIVRISIWFRFARLLILMPKHPLHYYRRGSMLSWRNLWLPH